MANSCGCDLSEKLFFVMANQSTQNKMNCLKTGFEHRGLQNYRVVIGGMPLNADFINHQTPSDMNEMLTMASNYSPNVYWSNNSYTDNNYNTVAKTNALSRI